MHVYLHDDTASFFLLSFFLSFFLSSDNATSSNIFLKKKRSADALADQTCGGTKPAAAPEPVHPSTLAAAPAPAMVGDGGGTIWNGIIAPLTKMRYAGMVWYQGESNDNEAVK